ncbi:MAG: aspartate--tRNA ligase [Candidatus Yanofskybacteria bacterium]|nr:aspartate--tRNA ligase [Candidatus Yanofskybacteria bacterium]
MKELSILEAKDLAGKEVTLYGWVANRRDHGKLVFVDLRDRSGIIQVVFGPFTPDCYEQAQTLRNEWVVRMRGLVKERPEKMVNPDIPTGRVEFEPRELEILNRSETPPMPLDTEGYEIGEDTRHEWRYLDLRRARLARNMKARHDGQLFVRNWLSEKGFLEIETPILTRSTPEGARDYVVPSRLYPGTFYALPQSPQQYKQLLMVAGMERYFQFARCFRDEDTRGDRQPEFTQLDMEMSFVEREDVMALNEQLLIDLVAKLYPQKRIQQVPFPRISYAEAMANYGTDRPDLREDKNDLNLLAFCWVIDFPFFEKNEDSPSGWTFTHNPFSAPKPEHMDLLLKQERVGDILTTQYDIVLNGWEIGGGSIRNHTPEGLRAVFRIMGFEEQRIDENFGHMLTALAHGAPPHGGIAWGWDRLIALLYNEPNIREVLAFPKTGDARDLMMHSPAPISSRQLRELHLSPEGGTRARSDQ